MNKKNRTRAGRIVRDVAKVTPRIYVADLAAYNAGKLHGAWIDATLYPDEIQEQIDEILKTGSGGEEWAIHDTEGFGDVKVGELEGIDAVSRVANAITEHGPVFAKVLAHKGTDYLDDAIEAMEENYQGEYDSLADWAYDQAKETGELDKIPEHYQNYMDWEGYADDTETNGDIFSVEVGGKVHVFSNR